MQIIQTSVGALPRLDPQTGRVPRRIGVVYEVRNPSMSDVISALWWQSYLAKDDPLIADVVEVYGFCCNQDVDYTQIFTYFKNFKFRNDSVYGFVDQLPTAQAEKIMRTERRGDAPELLRSLAQMIREGGGDCDDFTVNITGCLLRANDVRRGKGQAPYEVEHVYATAPGDSEPSHVFLRARHPNWPESPDRILHQRQGWVYLDVPFTTAAGQLAVGPPKWKLQAVAPMAPH